MALKVDLRNFLDEKGSVLDLTEQAKVVFTFVTNIIFAASANKAKGKMAVDVKCNTRSSEVSCSGSIEAICCTNNLIEWHCDTCEASGTISNWQASLWDRQERTLH